MKKNFDPRSTLDSLVKINISMVIVTMKSGFEPDNTLQSTI